MKKNYFTILLLSAFISLPAFAGDAVFSNSDSEKFELQPLNYTTSAISSQPTSAPSAYPSATSTVNKTQTSTENKNYVNAINNLDNAQVEIRDQLARYNALMAQSKTNYEAKKDEYKSYKKEYNSLKRKLNQIEKSKKIIQENCTLQNVNNY